MGASTSITLEDEQNINIEETPTGETSVYTTHINNKSHKNQNNDEPPTISEPYQPGAVIINQNENNQSSSSYKELQPGQEYSPPPPLPFKQHPIPSMKHMSNKFKQYSVNNTMYPAKNGPIAIARRLNIPIENIPDIDPNDELLGDEKFMNKIKNEYMNDNLQLAMMGFENEIKNLRYLIKFCNVKKVIDLYLQPIKYSNIFIGDRVIRGDHWKWGNQDGGYGLKGTVCALRQWIPNNNNNKVTEVVVLWDHGLYGNYRFGYYFAYDIKVIERSNISSEKQISVGDYVERNKINWRWKNQDGGYDNNNNNNNNHNNNNIGIITELYAIPCKTYEMDTVFAVLWDNEKDKYKLLNDNYMENNPKIDNEFAFHEFDEKEFDLINNIEIDINEKIRNYKMNVHKVRLSVQMKMDMKNNSDIMEWNETDFDEILAKPIPQYRLSYGDVFVLDRMNMKRDKYLMVGDIVGKTKNFKQYNNGIECDNSVVTRVEKYKIWTCWSLSRCFTFLNDGFDEIKFVESGNCIYDENNIKIGDRVKRGNDVGTVVCLQGIFKIDGVIVKVKWNKSKHVNLYSFGYDNIYDVKKINKLFSDYESFLLCQSNDSMMDMYMPSAPVIENNSVDDDGIECFDDKLKPSAPVMDDDM